MPDPATICVVQARMGSTRLPGKSLAPVYGDISLLELVLLRCMRAESVDLVVLATSQNQDCDPLVRLAGHLGVSVVRGDEENVLGRFVKAVDLFHPHRVIRVCADNPLVSPEEIDKLVGFFIKERYDYAANNTPECGLPDGLGCEIIGSDVLRELEKQAQDVFSREHVTTYIKAHTGNYRIGWLIAQSDLFFPDAKLDIDTVEDLLKVKRFCRGLPARDDVFWTSQEIVEHARKFDVHQK